MAEAHKAGFISIIGKPNAGKSTLLNALMGMKFVITTDKVQTTRHRILGIVNHTNTQLVFSDTPGIIMPHYKLQERMMDEVTASVEDADVVVMVVDVKDPTLSDDIIEMLNTSKAKKVLVLNKMDLSEQDKVAELITEVQKDVLCDEVIVISALHKFNTDKLLDLLAELCPEHPPYFPEDQMTDRPERFFVSELIREKILVHYRAEIPYSVEVSVESFKEKSNIIHIEAMIYTERKSQKGILIGKDGLGLKRVGTEARRDIEEFLQKKVFLKLFVKVREKWRSSENQLRKFGYGD